MMTRPTISVFFAPSRLDTQLVHEHRHRGDDEVAGEQQLTWLGVASQLLGQRRQDRVDQADAHEAR